MLNGEDAWSLVLENTGLLVFCKSTLTSLKYYQGIIKHDHFAKGFQLTSTVAEVRGTFCGYLFSNSTVSI